MSFFYFDKTYYGNGNENENENLNTYQQFIETNDIKYLNKLAINLDKKNEYKLKNIHTSLNFKNGSLDEEYPEQLMSTIFLDNTSKVLEIGGNVGRNSMIIASIVDNSNYVTIESDKNSANLLKLNMELNNFNFNICTSAISNYNLIQSGWETKISDVVLDGYFPVDTIKYNDFIKLYPIEFNTLVLDCEGAFYYILRDFPEILNSIKLILVENDYINPEHEEYIKNKLIENGFKLVYCKNIINECWKNKENFFEVWKKYD